jgi:hypothetical protein
MARIRWIGRTVLLSVVLGATATALLLLTKYDPNLMESALRSKPSWLVPALFAGLTSWAGLGFWVWSRIETTRAQGAPGLDAVGPGFLGWGVLIVALMSFTGALQIVPGPWLTALVRPIFLATVLLHAYLGWPVWLASGYFWSRVTLKPSRNPIKR